MSITTRAGKGGRTIIEKDGFDEKWGAVMQGALAGKVSLPPDVKIAKGRDGELFAEWTVDGVEIRRGTLTGAFHAAARGEIEGAKCYGIREIGQ